jgi:hypothetical protein
MKEKGENNKMKYQFLKQYILGHNCRRCINKEFHLNLVPEDCIYMEYRYECKSCKQIQNIVYDIRKGKRYKVFFGHE